LTFKIENGFSCPAFENVYTSFGALEQELVQDRQTDVHGRLVRSITMAALFNN